MNIIESKSVEHFLINRSSPNSWLLVVFAQPRILAQTRARRAPQEPSAALGFPVPLVGALALVLPRRAHAFMPALGSPYPPTAPSRATPMEEKEIRVRVV